MQTNWDAIVIGSGMGGMACANALSRVGKKVLVLEQHYVAGGMTHTFNRKGFTWDVGVHALGEMSEKRIPGKILRFLSDKKIEMHHYADIYDTFYFPDGYVFGLPSSMKYYVERLKNDFPHEHKAIDEYIKKIKEAAKSTRKLFITRSLPYLIDTMIGKFLRRDFDKWAKVTTKEVLESLTQDKRLIAVLAGQWGYYGSPPSESCFFMHAATVRHFWEGAYYPIGNSKNIGKYLLEPVTNSGGEVKVRSKVKELIMDGNAVTGVRLESGQEYHSQLVVSAIGARATVKHLVPAAQKQDNWCRDISALKQTPGHICLYLGLEGDITQTEATKSNQWIYETYDMEECVWKVEDQNSTAPCLYVSFPSLKDPTHKEGNKYMAEVVTFVDWNNFTKWTDTKYKNRPEDYKAFKESMLNRLITQMKKYYPKLMAQVTYMDFSTPLSTEHFCGSDRGAIYGLAPTPARFACRHLRPKTPIKNFYMTGSDIGTLGVVGAMMGGILTASNIDKKFFKLLK